MVPFFHAVSQFNGTGWQTAYTYILSQQVSKHKLQHQCELYSTAAISLSMSGREFTEESVGKINLEKVKG